MGPYKWFYLLTYLLTYIIITFVLNVIKVKTVLVQVFIQGHSIKYKIERHELLMRSTVRLKTGVESNYVIG